MPCFRLGNGDVYTQSDTPVAGAQTPTKTIGGREVEQIVVRESELS